MPKLAHNYVRNLVAYEPGKPVEDLARELGIPANSIIKLASNENPLGPSPKALAAMEKELHRSHFYPDGGAFYLREALAEKFGLARENFILGNGSNEIIEFVSHAYLGHGHNVVTSTHAFAVYHLMAQLFGVETIKVPDPGFVVDIDATLKAITPNTRIVFIANPNNPTGTLVQQADIDRYMAAVPEHVLTVFDEAYYEFLDTPPDTIRYVREGRRVVVMRTFSKIYGLANLRIGYGIAPVEIARILQKTRQPFNANGIAQAGAIAALSDDAHMHETQRVTREGRRLLESTFAQWGLEYVPSAANFVLVHVGDGDAIFQALLKKGIIVRAMRSYGLPEWIRVSVGTSDQNKRFLEEVEPLVKPSAPGQN